MPSIRVLCRDHPVRTLLVVTSEDALIFQHSLGEPVGNVLPINGDTQRCLVEFASLSSIDFTGYRTLGSGYGILGLVTIDQDVFVCIVTRSSKAATVRPGETVLRIEDVDFCKTPVVLNCFSLCLTNKDCLNCSEYESSLYYDKESSSATEDSNPNAGMTEDPFLGLKKLLNDGSFYYSLDFNLTDRLQDRYDDESIRL